MSLVTLLLSGSAVRADLISWTYNWTPGAPAVFADSPGTSKITLSDEKAGSATGSTDIVATNLQTFSTADPAHPDTFTHRGYSLLLTITNMSNPGHPSGTLQFAGEFNGTLSAHSSNVVNTYLGATTKSIVLGGSTFTVNLDNFTRPPPPNASNSGSIGAHAVATAGSSTSGGGGGNAPEPSTLWLAGLGMGSLGIAVWGKRQAILPLAA
jgi:hypothetical protein